MKKLVPPKPMKLPAGKQRRLDQLLDKNSQGMITRKEKTTLERLVGEAEELMIANPNARSRVGLCGKHCE